MEAHELAQHRDARIYAQRLQARARDLSEHLAADELAAVLEDLTSIRALCDIVGGEVRRQYLNLNDVELSEALHG